MTKGSEITPLELYTRLMAAWSAESSSRWRPDNPATGQCSVTALVAQDILGGDILKTRTPGGTHVYNRIGGIKWDFTISQFDRPIPFEDLPSSREEAMADTSSVQYEALKTRLGV
ncbi:hypothetical protein [Aquamicrobium sp.]|uniref:YunG family protein n=1 Tax=Aquamicrobium sp. TaxID=1872579 RepID=UPI002585E680|nr:hypothetical protein [Aquamicrobium sp.]MCK9553513.1 hypothetical protein [Aquamicrobium sp.]